MIKIGMLGGLGPESTLDYYKLLIETYRNKVGYENNPEIIIYSMDINNLLKLIGNKQWDEVTELLVNSIKVLHNAGADFGFISANTPHIVFDRVNELSPIPLISIVDKTCDYIKNTGVKKIGLLGTSFTMESDFYKKACDKKNLEIFIPNKEEREYIQNKLMTEIELGNFFEDTREGILNIIKRMINDDSIEGVILGCTELPLILTENSYFNIPFFNTTKIHVGSIIDYYLEAAQISNS